jgi:hypothetical protein
MVLRILSGGAIAALAGVTMLALSNVMGARLSRRSPARL